MRKGRYRGGIGEIAIGEIEGRFHECNRGHLKEIKCMYADREIACMRKGDTAGDCMRREIQRRLHAKGR